jgi:hypothetical protein
VPTTCDEAHGSPGCCSADGKIVYYSASGIGVSTIDCSVIDQVCTWFADSSVYSCGDGATIGDPSGQFPLACGAPLLPKDLTSCKTVCTTNADCKDAPGTLACDTSSGGCVECVVDADCAGNKGGPACNTVSNICFVKCQTDADCKDPVLPGCDPVSGFCGECRNNQDCQQPDAPACSPAKSCVPCLTSADCKNNPNGPACDTAFDICVECVTDADCKGNPKGTSCDVPNNRCFTRCTSNADCNNDPGGPACDPVAGFCHECVTNQDCTKPEAPVCGASQTCVECSSDLDCQGHPTGPTCNQDYHACGCAAAADCKSNPGGASCLPIFDTLAACGCSSDADCAGAMAQGPSCLQGLCATKCHADQDCKDLARPACEVASGICWECNTSKDCKTSGLPACNPDHACVACVTSEDCKGNKLGALCDVASNACVACLTAFDCTDPKKPACNQGSCETEPFCQGDDPSEDSDDGPSGATDITPTTGNQNSVTNHKICGFPSSEADYFRFTASDGDDVTLSLSWADTAQDLDISVFDASGNSVGADYYLLPAVVKLDYLPKGVYFIAITRFDGLPGSDAVTPYTLDFSRTTGNKCTSITDCAKDGASSLLRGSCNAAGACESIDGQGKVAQGKACDSGDDCASGICAETLFNQNSSKFAFCTTPCAADKDCTAEQVCTTAFTSNFCTARCTKNTECPASTGQAPSGSEPWAYLTCNAATGKCAL